MKDVAVAAPDGVLELSAQESVAPELRVVSDSSHSSLESLVGHYNQRVSETPNSVQYFLLSRFLVDWRKASGSWSHDDNLAAEHFTLREAQKLHPDHTKAIFSELDYHGLGS